MTVDPSRDREGDDTDAAAPLPHLVDTPKASPPLDLTHPPPPAAPDLAQQTPNFTQHPPHPTHILLKRRSIQHILLKRQSTQQTRHPIDSPQHTHHPIECPLNRHTTQHTPHLTETPLNISYSTDTPPDRQPTNTYPHPTDTPKSHRRHPTHQARRASASYGGGCPGG